jgi:hypothetical protein
MDLRGLGIFAKEPIPGQVKTRLSPPLSAGEAAEIYRVSLEETVAVMLAGPFDVRLFFAGGADFFRSRFPQLTAHPQSAGDLGSRLSAASAQLFHAGHKQVALIGSDSPDLPVSLVCEAFAALEAADAVAIPAVDGGYVLIATRSHFPALFADIPWSTTEVLAASRSQALRLGLRWKEVGLWEDMDDFASLQRLLKRSPETATASHVRKVLAEQSVRFSQEPGPNQAADVAEPDHSAD